MRRTLGLLATLGSVIGLPQGGGDSCDITFGSSAYSYEAGADTCGFGAGPGDVVNGADPQLGALGPNGGPTQTRLPATTSPLLERIPAASCGGPGPPIPTITADQRGVARPQGTACDIGAVEVAALSSDDLTFTG